MFDLHIVPSGAPLGPPAVPAFITMPPGPGPGVIAPIPPTPVPAGSDIVLTVPGPMDATLDNVSITIACTTP